jgi:hypothetical protein
VTQVTNNRANNAERKQTNTPTMQKSKIIELNGIFLGAAVALRDQPGWRVVATDSRIGPADGRIAATYQDASALARAAFWAWERQAA